MDVRTLVDHIQSRGFSLRLVGDKVRIEGPEPDQQASVIIEELRRRREEVRAIVGERAEADSPEALAVSVLAESDSVEVGRILDVWRQIFGITLDRGMVEGHLRALRRWERREQ